MRRGIGAEERKMTKTQLTSSILTAEITDDTVRVRDPRGRIWYPDEDAEAEIRG